MSLLETDLAAAEERFKTHKERKAAGHPLYSTSYSEIGKIPRGAHVELKKPEAAKAGDFSKTFVGGPFKDSGLNTTKTRHRFLKELDG